MNATMTETLRLTVHYPAAGEPFKDENADRTETVGHLKARVLSEFGLVEGSNSDGNQVTYWLFHEKTRLEDLNQTLGSLAGEKKVLQLKLSQQITQGDATAELSSMLLAADLAEARTVADAEHWETTLGAATEVIVTVSPASHPDHRYLARLYWNRYPDEPPSLKFKDPATGRLDLPSAWPVVRGFRPTSLDACVNWCHEGFVIHPEWKQDPNLRWSSRGNVLLKVVRILKDELDNYYSGRHGT